MRKPLVAALSLVVSLSLVGSAVEARAKANRSSLQVAAATVPAESAAGKPSSPTDKPAAEGVVVFEYRNDVKALADLPERVTQALTQNTSLRVITLTEARRRLGPGMDAEVARCDGETRCLSQVGLRLGVREVLLLAVSQLGDVVLALQRIAVAEQKVTGRFADSIVVGQAIDEARILSWLQQLFPPDTFKRYGQIQVSANVGGAQIYVNSKASGNTPLASALQVLAPGNYRILVEKPKFLPFQAAVTVMPDTTVEVSATLVSEQKQTPWYRRWYVWTGIIAGVGAVAATAVAVKLGTEVPPPDTTQLPGTIVFK
ncbi:MAG: PEGA domain-containing protein [Deltaproteobacteria bacterium]|nr:PEGA domain-containing protein [Deltaproteobacteria bacterium]